MQMFKLSECCVCHKRIVLELKTECFKFFEEKVQMCCVVLYFRCVGCVAARVRRTKSAGKGSWQCKEDTQHVPEEGQDGQEMFFVRKNLWLELGFFHGAIYYSNAYQSSSLIQSICTVILAWFYHFIN